ncbi:MAG: trypsin-like peptidase domain-containing protein [Clostridia bacterium]|nr:trypsin-like peptidase domain-containing protein [Clostridia bacterium]
MRKFVKAMIVSGVVLAILLSLSLNVFAIGFNAEEKYNSIFVIESGNTLGSGFAFGKNCIITNAHVISNSKSITVIDYSGSRMKASLILQDTAVDIALIAVADKEFTPILPSDLDKLQAGDDVYAIGAPNSMAYTLTKGVVSSKSRTYRGVNYIQTDAAINKGNSGGPLLDNDGNVIGVNSMKISDNEGIGLAISIADVISLLKKQGVPLNENGNIGETIEAGFTPSQVSETDSSSEAVKTKTETVENPLNVIILILLGISVCLNIVFIIIFIYRKNKNENPKYDPKERTDFDIDILG